MHKFNPAIKKKKLGCSRPNAIWQENDNHATDMLDEIYSGVFFLQGQGAIGDLT